MDFLKRFSAAMDAFRGTPRISAQTGVGPTSSYEGAALGRRTMGWNPGNDSVNTALFGVAETLRARSRDLIRKNAWAHNGSEVLVSECIGTGIKPQSLHPDVDRKAFLQKLWAEWADYSDTYGQQDFYGLQALAFRSMIEGGECFIRLRYRGANSGLTVPLQLQILEAEHCPTTKNQTLDNGSAIRGGIEFNRFGDRVAYWMYRNHPGERSPFIGGVPDDSQLVRVPASNVIHLYQPLRPGQIRGEPRLSRALVRLFDYDQYTDAKLVRAKVEALLAGFITETNADDPVIPETATLPDGTGAEINSGLSFTGLEPGTLQKLRPGEDVKFLDPSSAGTGFRDFNVAVLREIAAAVGVTYEQLTGDLTGVNYSSIRAGLLGFRRRMEQIQHSVVVFQMCRPIWEAWIETAVYGQQIKARDYTRNKADYLAVKWIPPGWKWVDPEKEINAAKEAVRCGFSSTTQVISEQGYDIEDTFAEIEHENELSDRLGLRRDTDPRYTASNGAAVAGPPAQGTTPRPSNTPEPDGEPVTTVIQ
jgi:lambda family phage portal protein